VLTSEHLDVRQGQRLIVTGPLLVIDHPPGFVGKTWFPGLTEVRVETRPHWRPGVVPPVGVGPPPAFSSGRVSCPGPGPR
jgi:hypothetical protein